MATTVQILTTNYSGQTATITFSPCSGGTINLGSHVIPYNYISDNYLGDYSLYFADFNQTCTFSIPCSTPTPTPTVIVATATPTPLPATSTPTLVPTDTPTPLPATSTPTLVPTDTPTPLPATSTPTLVPTDTPTPLPATSTPTPTLSETSTPTPLPATSTPTPTLSETSTPTPQPTAFVCNDCRNWEYNTVPVEGDVIHYFSCVDGSLQTISVNNGDTGNFCNCNSVANPYGQNGTQLTEIGICINPTDTPTPVPTNISTSTPTPLPATSTPTPTSALYPVVLYYGSVDCETTCGIYGGPSNFDTFYIDSEDFGTATKIYADAVFTPTFPYFFTNGSICGSSDGAGNLTPPSPCPSASTSTPTPQPTSTSTPQPTSTPTETPIPAPATPTPQPTATETPTPEPATSTPTPQPTGEPTNTPTPTPTPTSTSTPTPTPNISNLTLSKSYTYDCNDGLIFSYTLTSDVPVDYNTFAYFVDEIDLVGGGTILITGSTGIAVGNTEGTTLYNNNTTPSTPTGYTHINLAGTSTITSINFTYNGLPYNGPWFDANGTFPNPTYPFSGATFTRQYEYDITYGVVVTYTLETTSPSQEPFTYSFTDSLGLVSGGTYDITTSVTVASGNTIGTNIINNVTTPSTSGLTWEMLDQTSTLSGDSITYCSVPYSGPYGIGNSTFINPATPTPTSTSTATPTPTPLPATSTPTPTNTNTPEPATATPTPTNTNTPTPLPATSTPTPTPTNTLTPTATPFQSTFSVNVSTISLLDACQGGDLGLQTITVVGSTICNATSIVTVPSVVLSEITFNGDMYVHQKIGPTFYSRHFRRDGNGTTFSPIDVCVDCNTIIPTATPTVAPTSTPTNTPTPLPATATPTPTNTLTPTVTPVPATATPTPTNTLTPTVTPLPATSTPTPTPLPATSTPTPEPTSTPTPTPQPVINVNYHGTTPPTGLYACNGGTQITVSMNNSDFCAATTYTSNFFTSLGTTTYYISYNGNYVQIFHVSGSNQATRSGSCQACNNTPATAEPTAVPTSTPTPPPTDTPLPATSTPLPATSTPTPEPATPTPEPATPTPEPATSTPTPEGPSYDYYTADVYDCNDCSASTETITVAFAAGSSVTLNRFYIAEAGADGFSYRVTSSTVPSSPAYILSTIWTSQTTCSAACAL